MESQVFNQGDFVIGTNGVSESYLPPTKLQCRARGERMTKGAIYESGQQGKKGPEHGCSGHKFACSIP